MEAKVEMFFQGKKILVGTHVLFLPISLFPKKGNFYSKMPFLNPRPPKLPISQAIFVLPILECISIKISTTVHSAPKKTSICKATEVPQESLLSFGISIYRGNRDKG